MTPSGGTISNRTARGFAGARRTKPNPSAAAARRAAAATPHARRSRLFRRAATGAGRPACDPPSAIHWSCSLTSCAVWNRSSGSLARHVLTTLLTAGGIIGAISVTEVGASRRIDPARLAWLLPVKAFRPVAIS